MGQTTGNPQISQRMPMQQPSQQNYRQPQMKPSPFVPNNIVTSPMMGGSPTISKEPLPPIGSLDGNPIVKEPPLSNNAPPVGPNGFKNMGNFGGIGGAGPMANPAVTANQVPR